MLNAIYSWIISSGSLEKTNAEFYKKKKKEMRKIINVLELFW